MPTSEPRNALTRRQMLLGAASVSVALRPRAAEKARTRTRGKPFDLESFVDDCVRANNATADAHLAVQAIVARAMSDTGAVLSSVGAPRKGGIRTLHRSPDLTILNIVWAPLMQLIPHEHNMWAVIGIYTGREDNIFWERHGGHVVAARATALSEGDVTALPRDVIHSVTNPIERLTGAIHIYGGDFFATPRSEWDPETLAERPWDLPGAVRLFEESNDRFFGWQARTTRPRETQPPAHVSQQ
jgi:predicted metal-dependent enzyme (double-stranded beta helix superfamily)